MEFIPRQVVTDNFWCKGKYHKFIPQLSLWLSIIWLMSIQLLTIPYLCISFFLFFIYTHLHLTRCLKNINSLRFRHRNVCQQNWTRSKHRGCLFEFSVAFKITLYHIRLNCCCTTSDIKKKKKKWNPACINDRECALHFKKCETYSLSFIL